ncbi:MAG TPA: response regulator transcription factor [Burkholderiales bacterium]|nr:response regulator transcription factor [Burkholderiales bacterium]
MRVLLVEDDPMIGESIRTGLRHDGYVVDWVQDGRAAEIAIESEPYALVLLDLGLPRKDGFSVLASLRARKQRVPVLILTARDAVSDRVKGLDAGADDYLVKPFDLDELAARMRAVLRREAGRAEPLVSHGALSLNPATHEVSHHGNTVPVSAREFALLQALLQRPGAALSRAQLEERLYGWGEEVASNAVEVHIHNLRKKLGDHVIRTVRGIGYAIAGEDQGAGA